MSASSGAPCFSFATVRGPPPQASQTRPARAENAPHDYRFDGSISRDVLENYLSRSITMEGMLNGRGDLE